MATVAGSQIVGTAGTLTVAGTNIIPQVEMRVNNYGRESRPIFSVMAKLGLIEDAHNMTYEWQEIQYDEPSVNCETAITGSGAGGTHTVVLDTLACVVGDKFEEPVTNQLFEISSVTSQDTTAVTSTVVVKKRPFSAASSSTTANSMFMRMGNTKIEGGRFKDPTVKTPLRLSNNLAELTQQVKITKPMEQLWLYSGMSHFQMDLENVQDQLNHDIERNVIFGKAYQESATLARAGGTETGMTRGSQGVWDRIQSKRVGYTGSITEAGIDGYLTDYLFGDVFGGGAVKLGFHGNRVGFDIAQFVKNRYRKLDSTSTYGMQINEYISPVGGGTVYLIEERQFFPTFGSWSGSEGTSNSAHANTILFLDPAYFSLMKLYAGLMMIQNSSDPEQSQKAIGIDFAGGVKLKNERFHGIYSHTV